MKDKPSHTAIHTKILSTCIYTIVFFITSFLIIFFALPVSKLLFLLLSPNMSFFSFYSSLRSIFIGLNFIMISPVINWLMLGSIYPQESRKFRLIVLALNFLVAIGAFYLLYTVSK